MFNQWRAGSGRPHPSGIGGLVGTIGVGRIFYIQDGVRPFGRDRFARTVRYSPWIVESWHNREYAAHHQEEGRWVKAMMAGGHLATVRCLRTGRRKTVADWILHWHNDQGCFEWHTETSITRARRRAEGKTNADQRQRPRSRPHPGRHPEHAIAV